MVKVDWLDQVETLLLLRDPQEKAIQSRALYKKWSACSETLESAQVYSGTKSTVRVLEEPGRLDRPALVDASRLPKRGLGSPVGRVGLLHSLAHIEFNAINLALDAVYRFRDMPIEYVTDWLRVASDEGEHFLLLSNRLKTLDSYYGALDAHDGLWDMARRTDHDVLVRMALVPRILEARGLDVAPPMAKKLRHVGDEESAKILDRIYQDEITHVEVGNRWFRYVCEQRDLNGVSVFRDLLNGENSAYLRSPYNDAARLQAGFTREEMAVIREMETEYAEYKNKHNSRTKA
ncbi:MAG: ferritin-like domain-containing protein [Granulosicoccus sp.]|nr:ferritin-like domain-containing protein [Granulosicoccus sp.]